MKKKRYVREQRLFRFRSTIEIDRVHRGGWHKEKRGKREKPTPEQMAKNNLYNKIRKLRRIICENYKENDYWFTLTYQKGYRTDEIAARKDFSKFVRKLRTAYRKKGYELLWVVRTDIGEKGAAHHHVLINRIPDGDKLVKACWKETEGSGYPFFKPTYEEGGFKELAEYITKPPPKEGIKHNYSRSRNLKNPEPEISRCYKADMQREPDPPEGYYLDRDSLVMGINPITGYEYQHFILIQIPEQINRRKRDVSD